jgi:hypothetical protein
MISLNNILHRKVNWISQILRINCLFQDTTEGQMTEVKGIIIVIIIIIIIIITHFLDDLRNRRKYRRSSLKTALHNVGHSVI